MQLSRLRKLYNNRPVNVNMGVLETEGNQHDENHRTDWRDELGIVVGILPPHQ